MTFWKAIVGIACLFMVGCVSQRECTRAREVSRLTGYSEGIAWRDGLSDTNALIEHWVDELREGQLTYSEFKFLVKGRMAVEMGKADE